MFDKTFTRIPKTVYALQWLPHARLPGVTNIMGEVTSPGFSTAMGLSYNPADPMQPPRSPKITCIGGKVKLLDNQDYDLEPHDWVIYSCETQQPIQVLSEKMFPQIYVDSGVFKLCDACAETAKNINKPVENKTFNDFASDYINLLRMGKTVLFPTPTGNVEIKTEQEFREYCARFGKTI